MSEATQHPYLVTCPANYIPLCEEMGLQPLSLDDFEAAKKHPAFLTNLHALLEKSARKYHCVLPLLERKPLFSISINEFPSLQQAINSTEVSESALTTAMHMGPEMYVGTEIFDFVLGTVEELTGEDSASTSELYEAVVLHGFIMPPQPAAAFAIRKKYLHIPRGQDLLILSEPVKYQGGGRAILGIKNRLDESRYIYDRHFRTNTVWNGNQSLLLCRKRW